MTKSNSKIRNLRDALGTYPLSVAAVDVFSLFINLLILPPMFCMINVYDKAVATGIMPTLMSLGFIAAFLYLMVALLEWFRSVVMIHVAIRLDHLIAPGMYELSFKSEVRSLDAARKTVRAGTARVTDVLLTLAHIQGLSATSTRRDFSEPRAGLSLSWSSVVIPRC